MVNSSNHFRRIGVVESWILGLCLLSGLIALGYLLGNAALSVKALERTVVVKGLSEREVPADKVIWPVQFSVAGNDLGKLYEELETKAETIALFLKKAGIAEADISLSPPSVTDKSAQQWGEARIEFRYTALQNVTVHSQDVAGVRKVMNQLSELGKQGIVFTAGDYQYRTEYLFTGLNELKPHMIEEATKNAREVAEKFAQDSQSALGKIKQASQGQFSISPRDNNNPHIKNIRVVSTVEYYLSD